MKTKKLFLKLFLAAFFLAVFIPKDVHAAQTPISIDAVYGDITIAGTASNHNVVDGSNTEIATHNNDGYNFTDRNSDKKIIIEVEGTLNLTFTDLNLLGNSQLEIRKGTVIVTLKNSKNPSNTLQNNSGSAIVLSNDSKIMFQGTGKIMVEGHGSSGHAVSGGKLDIACSTGGAVTLSVSEDKALPFNGEILTVKSGILQCERNGSLAEFGKKMLYFDGGTVNAKGIVGISYIDESLTGFEANTNHKITYTNDSDAPSTVPTDKTSANSEGKIKLLDEFNIFGQYIEIDNAQRIFLKKRPAEPKNIKHASETIAYTNKGTITLPSAEYELMGTNGNSPTSWFTPNPPDYTMSNLPPGEYKVREKSNDSAFASESVIIKLELGRLLTVTPPELNPVTYDDEKHKNPDSHAFKIESHDINRTITISSIYPVSGSKTDWYTLSGNPDNLDVSISSGATEDNVVSLQPKPNLDAGTYTVKFHFSYRIDGDNTPYSTPDPVTVTYVVNKKKQPTPTIGADDLKETKVTYDSITLSALTPPSGVTTGIEYSIDGKNWVKEPSFTKLNGDADYTIQARCKGDGKNYDASDPVEVQVHTETAAALKFKEEQIELPSYNRDYTITIGSDKVTAKGGEKLDIKETWFDKDVVIHDETKDYDQTLHIRKRDKAPTGFKATDETIASYHDGKISGVGPAMEYKKDSWNSWEPCTGATIEKNTITQLEPGTYFIRNAATDGKFASISSEPIVVKKGKLINVVVDPFEPMVYGNTPDTRDIKITNYDKENAVTIEGMSVDPQMFVISEGDKTVAADGELFNWKIQPKEKLNVGTYTAELIVSYNNSQNTTPDEPDDPDNPDDSNNPTDPDDTNTPTDPDDPDDSNNPTDPDDTNTPTTPTNPDGSGETGGDEPAVIAQETDDSANNSDDEKFEPFTVPVEITVNKATQDPPPVPAEKTKTATSITLETIPNSPISGAKAQYSKDGGKTWQDSPTFTGLSANREYTFVARYAETENYEASEISAGEIAITTAEKTDDSNVKPNANDNSNGTNGNNTNGNNTNGNGTNGNSTHGNGTNGTSGTSNGTSGVLSSAKTGDMNNIQLWVTLAVISYLSCMIIIRNKMKQSKA